MKKLITALAVVALASFALTACGSSNDSGGSSSTAASTPTGGSSGSSGGGETVAVDADPSGQLAFTKTALTAKPGQAKIELVNESPTGHDLILEDSDGNEVGKTDVITGSTASFDADLQPGTYTYFCDLPGHRQAGMEGTLTVK